MAHAPAAGIARFVLLRWAVTFTALHWLIPRAKARAQRWDADADELNQQLGRQPTPEEYFENWRRSQASWKAAGRPR